MHSDRGSPERLWQGKAQRALRLEPQTLAPTQMVGTGMWDPSQLGTDTLKWIDQAIKAEEDIRQETMVDSAEEAARKENEEEEKAFQDHVNGTADWQAERRAEEEELLRRTKAEAEAREAADRRMAEWLDREEKAEAAAKEATAKEEVEEVRPLNAAFAAARCRDWESWVLHDPPPGGGSARVRPGGGYILIKASLHQDGKPIAKKARWSVPLRRAAVSKLCPVQCTFVRGNTDKKGSKKQKTLP